MASWKDQAYGICRKTADTKTHSHSSLHGCRNQQRCLKPRMQTGTQGPQGVAAELAELKKRSQHLATYNANISASLPNSCKAIDLTTTLAVTMVDNLVPLPCLLP
jgi:hypothetical protein